MIFHQSEFDQRLVSIRVTMNNVTYHVHYRVTNKNDFYFRPSINMSKSRFDNAIASA